MSKKPLYDSNTGIHRAKIWEIALYALNNSSTNITFVIFGSIAFYLTGIVGVSTVVAGTIATVMRLWDGVTDPFIGYLVDKTNGRFGKNRPFIIIGNLIQFVGAGLIFMIIPAIPESFRFIAYVIFYMFYIIGYTFQCVVTKSAQSCLTNDPKQRPIFTVFDSTFNLVLFAVSPIITVNYMMPKYGEPGSAEVLANPGFYQEVWLVFGIISFIFACLAVVGLWRKDRTEFFGTGKAIKIGFKDYWDVLKNNRAIQMLVVSASSDKLAMQIMGNSVVFMMLFGVIVGDFTQQATMNAMLSMPIAILSILLIFFVATNMGQKKALLIGTYGALIGLAGMFALFVFGDPTTMDFHFTNGVTLFTVGFAFFWILIQVMTRMSGGIVIPMTADCADYEVYRSGKYVPGLMGTLFSFVDKMISAFATTVISVAVAAIGFTDSFPTADTPYSTDIFWVTMGLFIAFPVMGLICNVISMKFYPLTKDKMAEIQAKIAEIKRSYMTGK